MERKSMLGRSGIEYTDYYANFYEGCGHNCGYCYARKLKRRSTDEWKNAEPVDNACELLDKELSSGKFGPGEIMLCSTCDPYQPINRKYGLARDVIGKILSFPEWTILIQTKSADVISDIDLIADNKGRVKVGFTIITLNELVRREWEPSSSPLLTRFFALKAFHEMGVKTGISMEPILPGTPEREILEIIEKSHSYVDEYIFGKLEHMGSSPEAELYYKKLRPMIAEKCKEYGIKPYFKQKIGDF